MSALNKAVIPAILVLLCIGVRCSAMVAGGAFSSREADSTGSATRKLTKSCLSLLNRHGKRIAPLARIHFRSQATLCNFPERVRRSFTGFLQTSQYAIKWVRCPQYGGKTAFLHIEGRICTWASGLLSGSASVRIHSTSCVSHPAVGRASNRAF